MDQHQPPTGAGGWVCGGGGRGLQAGNGRTYGTNRNGGTQGGPHRAAPNCASAHKARMQRLPAGVPRAGASRRRPACVTARCQAPCPADPADPASCNAGVPWRGQEAGIFCRDVLPQCMPSPHLGPHLPPAPPPPRPTAHPPAPPPPTPTPLHSSSWRTPPYCRTAWRSGCSPSSST